MEDAHREVDRVPERVNVAELHDDAETAALDVREPEEQREAVADTETEAESDRLKAPDLLVLGDADEHRVATGDAEGDDAPVAVREGRGVLDGDDAAVDVFDVDTERESEAVTAEEGDDDDDGDSDRVRAGVTESEGECERVREGPAVPERDGVCEAHADGRGDALPDTERDVNALEAVARDEGEGRRDPV